MKFLREWAIALLTLACILSIFLGYFWRVYHEKKNWDKWSDAIKHEFLLELTDTGNQEVSYYKDWVFIKRADGSVVIKRR
ncbi:MAG: hypothetical protein QXV73_04005 [Candidatus Micrarchaeia archaeon]